ncbi:MAG: baseplate J/gp47 family protein [Firmicutes bacterium]|nr:baseplate J/gp47 family protein [Bacillota bacterium]
MFESITYEDILSDMLGRVSDSLDKREGSVIYDALAPCAAALKNVYTAMEDILLESYIGTATGEYLDRLAAEFGIVRISASAAVVKGEFNIDVALGKRFNGDENNYVVTESLGGHTYKMTCETAGSAGNGYTGIITPIEYIEGLQSAEITEILVPGSDEETDEELRVRVLFEVSDSARDGNAAQYYKWANEYTGIGNVKVFPLWDGPNTVKISILDAENGKATNSLISEFSNYMDPGSEGKGNGKAPVGAIVTVTTAQEVPVSITFSYTLNSGYSAIYGLAAELGKYFADISYKTETLSFYGVAAKILENASIASISNLKLNGASADISLEGEKIPVLVYINGEAV